MPYEVKKVGIHYMVRNKDTGHIFAQHTSALKAIKQMNLLRLLEANRSGR